MRACVLHVCVLVLLTLIRPDQMVREQARRRQGSLAARCGSCLQRAISVGNDALYDRRRRLDLVDQPGSLAEEDTRVVRIALHPCLAIGPIVAADAASLSSRPSHRSIKKFFRALAANSAGQANPRAMSGTRDAD